MGPVVMAGAAEAALHFVGDADAAVLADDVVDDLEDTPFGGVIVPPTPWIGSPMKQAISPGVSYWMTFLMSWAHFTPQLGYSSPNGQR